MKSDRIINDWVIENIVDVLNRKADKYNINVLSVVLYGSRARGDFSSQNEYEFTVLVDNNISLNEYIEYNNSLKIELIKEKMFLVKINIYTRETFENLLYNDSVVGAFLYMMCKENVVLFDKSGDFTSIKEGIISNNIKEEEEFIRQCIDFSKMLGSKKWEQKWEKTYMQYRYLKKGRSSFD